jgi:endoribonuclease Dicer
VKAFLGWRSLISRFQTLRKSSSRPQGRRNDSITIIVHGTVIVGPVTAGSLSVAKAIASESALTALSDNDSDHCLSQLCNCGQAMDIDDPPVGSDKEMEDPHDDINPATFLEVSDDREMNGVSN